MKRKRRLSATLAICTALGAFGRPTLAQPPGADQGSQPTPGTARPESLRVLEGLVGHWRVEATQYVRGRPPIKVTGTSENTWILGSRFVQCAASTGEGDGRVDSVTTFGYDPRNRQYFAVAVITSEMPYLSLRGPYYDASRSFVLQGEDTSSVGVRFKLRYIIRLEGKDRYVVESFLEYPGADPAMTAEIVYTRG